MSAADIVDAADKKDIPLKSINGRRCLTKCHAKGTHYLHPILLTGVTNDNNANCAIEPIYTRDAQYETEHYMIFDDQCHLGDNKIYQIPNELDSILLGFHFNPADFLTAMYHLHSFDEVIDWTLENDHLPFDTIKRVHNCAWLVYGKHPEELTIKVIDYYYEIAKNYWLRDYVKIILEKYSFNLVTTDRNNPVINAAEETYNIIVDRFFGEPFFAHTIKKYVYEFQDQWDTIVSHYGNLKKYVFQQLIANIEHKLSAAPE